MNWYYVLWGFIGIVIVFIADVVRTGYKQMQWPVTAAKYGVAVILLFALVHWRGGKEVEAFLYFASAAALIVGINWAYNKFFKSKS